MRISDWSSDVCASDLSECVQFAHGHRLSRYQRQDGRDTLSEPLIRHADDQAVLHAWVSRNDLFHFFGKNLLSASIDARGVAAQQDKGAIRRNLGIIAGEAITVSIHGAKRYRTFYRVRSEARRGGKGGVRTCRS